MLREDDLFSLPLNIWPVPLLPGGTMRLRVAPLKGEWFGEGTIECPDVRTGVVAGVALRRVGGRVGAKKGVEPGVIADRMWMNTIKMEHLYHTYTHTHTHLLLVME